jgi:hypothetical protein
MITREQKEKIILALIKTVREESADLNLTVGDFTEVMGAIVIGHFSAVADDASDPDMLFEFTNSFSLTMAQMAIGNYNLLTVTGVPN